MGETTQIQFSQQGYRQLTRALAEFAEALNGNLQPRPQPQEQPGPALPITADEEAPYRVGNHQQSNIYRGRDYIGVMFDPVDAAYVVQCLNNSWRRS